MILTIFSLFNSSQSFECPGSCWSIKDGICYPDQNKVYFFYSNKKILIVKDFGKYFEASLSCHPGRIELFAHSCLFINEETSFQNGETYEISFKNQTGVNFCRQRITQHGEVFSGR